MYFTVLRHGRHPHEPRHLGCVDDATGPNFSGPEFSPSLVTTWAGTWLYFSSTGYDNNMDIYVSRLQRNGTFAAPTKIEESSTPGDDRMPNVSRDGLKMVFSSDRTDLDGEQGSFDVYVSTRSCTVRARGPSRSTSDRTSTRLPERHAPPCPPMAGVSTSGGSVTSG